MAKALLLQAWSVGLCLTVQSLHHITDHFMCFNSEKVFRKKISVINEKKKER